MRVDLFLLAVTLSLGSAVAPVVAQTTVPCQRIAIPGFAGAKAGGWLGVLASVLGGTGGSFQGGAEDDEEIEAYVAESTSDSDSAGNYAYSEHTQTGNCFVPVGAWDSAPEVDTLLTATSTLSGPDSDVSDVGFGSLAAATSVWQVDPGAAGPANLYGTLHIEADGTGATAGNGVLIYVVCGNSHLQFDSRGDAWIANGIVQQATVDNPNAAPIYFTDVGYPPTFTLEFTTSEVVTPGQKLQILGAVEDGAGAGEGSRGEAYNLFFKGATWFTVKTP